MRSKWLDGISSPDVYSDSNAMVECQPSTSGRHHGARWVSVMQGIRRSLDVHMKNYCKIDSVFASTMRLSSAGDKLKALTRALTDTGLVDFSCVYLLHPARGTFGVVALSGSGSELYPPLLTDNGIKQAVSRSESGFPAVPNIFTRSVFQVKDSNWCVEDVAASRAPWYYDCASAANGFGLPQDGGWLRCSGMRSVLALPCMQGNDVTGVLAVASKQKSLDHSLLRKMEELCYKITPIVTDAVLEFSALLCNRRVVSRYESVSDFAHEVLGELLNLDRAVVGCIHRSSANVSQQQLLQPPASVASAAVTTAAAATAMTIAARGQGLGSGSTGRKRAADERAVFDASAAVAAAAAAGFTWTVPPPPPAPTVQAAAAMAAAPGGLHVDAEQEQPDRPFAQSVPGTDTYFTALTGGSNNSTVPVLDSPAAAPLKLADVPTMITVATLSERPTPAATAAAAAAVLVPLTPVGADTADTSACGVSPQPRGAVAQANVWSHQPPRGVGTTSSLPEPVTAAVAATTVSAVAEDYLRGSEAVPLSHQVLRNHNHHHRHHRGQQPGAMPAYCDRNASRSTRSISCLEFNGGLNEAQEELVSYSGSIGPRSAQPATAKSAAAAECVSKASACAAEPAASSRSSESGCATYMIESRSTEDLAAALRYGRQGASRGGMLTTPPSSKWSSKDMEDRVTRAAPAVQTVPPTAGGLSAAMGSSCGTEYSCLAVTETVTTRANSSRYANTSVYGSNALQLSSAFASQCDGGGSQCDGGDFNEARASLRGVVRGRWSRDSAAVAHAVSSNETGDAFAAAMRFTTGQACDGAATTAPPTCDDGTAAAAATIGTTAFITAQVDSPALARRGCSAAVLGGLYGIRESGSMSSLCSRLSLEFSDDGSVAVLDLPSNGSSSSGSGGVGRAFLLSSGLGVEALRRFEEWRDGGGGSGTTMEPSASLPVSNVPAERLTIRT